jgi:hypothetical protein
MPPGQSRHQSKGNKEDIKSEQGKEEAIRKADREALRKIIYAKEKICWQVWKPTEKRGRLKGKPTSRI